MQGFLEPGGAVVGGPDRSDLSLLDQLRIDLKRLFERRVGIRFVSQVEIESIGLQAPKALLHLLHDMSP
jgi:hypothetical protein